MVNVTRDIPNIASPNIASNEMLFRGSLPPVIVDVGNERVYRISVSSEVVDR
jgi:hypothetical protein